MSAGPGSDPGVDGSSDRPGRVPAARLLRPGPAAGRLQRHSGLAALPPGVAAPTLWAVDLARPLTDAEWAALSPAEQQRCRRQVFESGHRQLAASRAALRTVLGWAKGAAPSALEFEEGPQGKPGLAGGSGPPFNLSHSGDQALILVAPSTSRDEWGVDLEVLRPIEDRAAMSEQLFTRDERAELARRDPSDRDLDFLRLWTRKEACIKAVGCGLTLEPDRFQVGLAPGPVAVTLPWPDADRPTRVWCLPLELAGLIHGCVAAAAVRPVAD